jgi:hypothetical protein
VRAVRRSGQLLIVQELALRGWSVAPTEEGSGLGAAIGVLGLAARRRGGALRPVQNARAEGFRVQPWTLSRHRRLPARLARARNRSCQRARTQTNRHSHATTPEMVTRPASLRPSPRMLRRIDLRAGVVMWRAG